MRTAVQCLGVIVVCGVGFAAGRLTLTQPARSLADSTTEAALRAAFFQPPGDADDEEAEEDEGFEMNEAMEQASAPGPAHEVLNAFAGKWTGYVQFTMDPETDLSDKMPTSVTREWILGNRYLRETVTSNSEMGNYEALGVIGYDNFDGVYQSAWVDNMSTAIMMEQGVYDKTKKIFRFHGSHRDPMTGQLAVGTSEIDISNPNRHVMKGYTFGPDGAPYQNFYGVLERVK